MWALEVCFAVLKSFWPSSTSPLVYVPVRDIHTWSVRISSSRATNCTNPLMKIFKNVCHTLVCQPSSDVLLFQSSMHDKYFFFWWYSKTHMSVYYISLLFRTQTAFDERVMLTYLMRDRFTHRQIKFPQVRNWPARGPVCSLDCEHNSQQINILCTVRFDLLSLMGPWISTIHAAPVIQSSH